MKHLKKFPEFINETHTYKPSVGGLTPIQKAIKSANGTGPKSPDWFTRAEIDQIMAWGKSKGIEIAESINAPGSDGANYFGTPDGIGLHKSVEIFYKGEGGLCNELHISLGDKEEDIVKEGTKFRTSSGTFNNISQALPK